MKRLKQIFHIISFLQYPFYMLALYFSIKPYFNGLNYTIENPEVLLLNLNYFFIFLGLGISFSTLQDPDKIPFKFEKRILKNTKKAKIFIWILGIATLLMLLIGISGYFLIHIKIVNEISLGTLILGIGFLGLLKTQLDLIERYKNVN